MSIQGEIKSLRELKLRAKSHKGEIDKERQRGNHVSLSILVGVKKHQW